MSQASARPGKPESKPRSETVRNCPGGGVRFPALAVAASLLLHALLLAALRNAPLHRPPPKQQDRIITMHLTPSPALDRAQEDLSVEPQSGQQPRSQGRAEPADEPEDPETHPVPATAAGNADPESSVEPGGQSSAGEAGRVTQTPAMLRARILEQVEARPSRQGAEPLPWRSSGEPARGLPGTRGWIAGHIGTVRTSAHTWKANDGSSRGRYVMADGTVVCTRRRAPTVDELMNPWKSTVVTMAGVCGRERPEAPDFTDPRVQPPPARLVENSPGLDD